MEALNFGTANNTHWCMGTGPGPHVMADLENGLWAGNCTGTNPQNTPLPFEFVTAMLKGGSPAPKGGFALKGSDATMGPRESRSRVVLVEWCLGGCLVVRVGEEA